MGGMIIEFSESGLHAKTYGEGEKAKATPAKENPAFTKGAPLALASADEVPLFIKEGDKLIAFKADFPTLLEKDGVTERLAPLFAKEGIDPRGAICYIGPSLSFSHCPVSRALQEKLIAQGKRAACKRTSGVDYVDYQVLALLALRALGVPMKNIYVSPYCTYESKGLYSRSRGDQEENLTVAE